MKITYELREIEEQIAGTTLRLLCLKDLDATIDDVFSQLQRHGKEHLLEKLCPYFGVVWPSARALTEEIHERLRQLPDRSATRILELGCGLALPSLVLAIQGAASGDTVIATDSHPEVENLLEKNLALNPEARPCFQYQKLDWEHPPEIGPLDWLIASDVLYERAGVKPLAKAIERLASEKTRILIADPARPYLQAFTDEMTQLGFQHDTRIRQAKDTPGPKEIFLIEYKRTVP